MKHLTILLAFLMTLSAPVAAQDFDKGLAAYNAGPGNVNKAIRRSGNKKTYWEVRPYLPQETRGYVPNFIAAAYLMTYHKEHNIFAEKFNMHNIEVDTLCFKSSIHMGTISKVIDWPLEEIRALNPVFKSTYIPKSNPSYCLNGPHEIINLIAGLEDSLMALEHSIYGTDEVQVKQIFVQDSLSGDTIQKTIQNNLKRLPAHSQAYKFCSASSLKQLSQ